MKDAFYYLYEIVNLTNGKKYIGQHCTKDLNDNYVGTSKQLRQDIKNGDKYNVNIIQHFANIFDLGDAEFEMIKKTNACNKSEYYNKYNSRYYNVHFEFGRTDAEINKQKQTISLNHANAGEKNPMYGMGHKLIGNKNGSFGIGNATGKKWKVVNRKPQPKSTCIYCHKTVPVNIIARYHNEKCKHKI